MTKDNATYTKAYDLAIRIIKAYQYLCDERKEYVLSKQMLKCGTSIGSNIAEAEGAISEAEYNEKIGLAYKGCLETTYWLSLLKDTGYITDKTFQSIHREADEIGEILFSILQRTRNKK